jgi:16S rRNA (cytidine1402-2'-O)-methyltransferase
MGILYLVATPLGNLEDITLRALRILKEVDFIACEDTRYTARLLTHYGITTPRGSHHKFNEEKNTPKLIQWLREGKNIALVSDSGTPLISDPGFELVSACRLEGIQVIPIPGPSAAITALSAAGLPTDSFYFAGFLPARGALRRRKLEELMTIPATLIIYESPHRLLTSLEDMIAILGPRQATLARELTKIHEEFMHSTLPELLEILSAREEVRGEITLVIEGGEAMTAPIAAYPESIKEHLEAEMARTGLPRNEALKLVAKQRGITRKEAYNLLIENN